MKQGRYGPENKNSAIIIRFIAFVVSLLLRMGSFHIIKISIFQILKSFVAITLICYQMLLLCIMEKSFMNDKFGEMGAYIKFVAIK